MPKQITHEEITNYNLFADLNLGKYPEKEYLYDVVPFWGMELQKGIPDMWYLSILPHGKLDELAKYTYFDSYFAHRDMIIAGRIHNKSFTLVGVQPEVNQKNELF